MTPLSAELQIIKSCLDEIDEHVHDLELAEILAHLRQAVPPQPAIAFDNYATGSGTLKRDPHSSSLLENIRCGGAQLQTKGFALLELPELLLLNQTVRGLPEPQLRMTELRAPYPFPLTSVIPEGLALLDDFFRARREQHPFLTAVAYIQGLLSLHPFEEGNHRTSRLLLDHWLLSLGLPATKIVDPFDLIFANPVHAKIFSLADAAQKIIWAMNARCSSSLVSSEKESRG